MPPSFAALCADFAALDAAEDRYAYLLDLARMLPGIPQERRRDDMLVRGCLSRVWLCNGPSGPEADSDAQSVRGLLFLLLRAAAEGAEVEAAQVLRAAGLEGLISAQRGNGLAAAAARLRELQRAA